MRLTLCAPCHFALESVLKKELEALGFENIKAEDGRVFFETEEAGVARANMFLRTAERVMICAGLFKAKTFDELFEGIKALPWEDYIPKDGKIIIKKASSVRSGLFSPSDIQSITKKAIAERLKPKYRVNWLPESGAVYPVRVFIIKDMALAALDTSGDSLHKRGYRAVSNAAPISETLAAALIMLTPWKKDRILVDPFCGSGTICIEAAMMAANIAPGLKRSFTGRSWENLIPKAAWEAARKEAEEKIDFSVKTDIQGYDIDEASVKIAHENTAKAGVGNLIHFQRKDVSRLSHRKKYGFIITNPPYGERLEDKEKLPALYRTFGERFRALDSWSAYMITSYEEAERYFGQKAFKNRKIYNGMIKTYFYQFPGAKPPKKGAPK